MPMNAFGTWVTLHADDSLVALDIIPWGDFYGTTSTTPGARLYFVGVCVENTGAAVWNDTLAYGAIVVDNNGYQYEAINLSMRLQLGRCRLPPGDHRRGFIAFELPEQAEAAELLVTLDAGYGPDTGHWSLTERTAEVAIGGLTVGASAAPPQRTQVISGDDGVLEVVLTDAIDLTHTIPREDFSSDDSRALGIGLVVRNVGAERYAENLAYGAVLIDDRGWQFEPMTGGGGGPLLGQLMIPPGSHRVGYLLFEVDNDPPAVLALSLDAGFSDDLAEWDVRPLFADLEAGAPVVSEAAAVTPKHLAHETNPESRERLDLNTASEGDFAALPGVGAVLAKRAIAERTTRRGYNDIETFFQILGLKPHVASRLSDLVEIRGAPPPAPIRTQGRIVDY